MEMGAESPETIYIDEQFIKRARLRKRGDYYFEPDSEDAENCSVAYARGPEVRNVLEELRTDAHGRPC
jgi:hypothetical protein